MRRWSAAIAAAACACSATFGLFVAVPASAAAPDAQGWWTTVNTGLPAPPPNPDIPPEGLLVQGGGSGSPTAYAALLFQLPVGTVAQTLTLMITPNSGTTPLASLQVCPLRTPTFQPEQGGAIARAPAYSCAAKITAGPQSSGKSYQFDLAALGSSKPLAIAILPTSPTDRVVFDKPNADSLSTAQPGGDVAPVSTGPPAAAPLPSAGSGTPSAATDAPTTPIAPQADATAPDPNPQVSPASTPVATPDASLVSPAVTPPPPASTEVPAGQLAASSAARSSKGTPIAAALVLLAVVGAGLLWVFAGRAGPAEL